MNATTLNEGSVMKTLTLGGMTLAWLFAQVAAGLESNAVPLLQYGALGVLVMTLLIVFLKLLPSHNQVVRDVVSDHRQTMRDVVADHKQAVESVAERTEKAIDSIVKQHESSVTRICDEIKTCRGKHL